MITTEEEWDASEEKEWVLALLVDAVITLMRAAAAGRPAKCTCKRKRRECQGCMGGEAEDALAWVRDVNEEAGGFDWAASACGRQPRALRSLILDWWEKGGELVGFNDIKIMFGDARSRFGVKTFTKSGAAVRKFRHAA